MQRQPLPLLWLVQGICSCCVETSNLLQYLSWGDTFFFYFSSFLTRKTFLTLIYISLFTIFSLSIHFSPSSCTYAHTHARLRRSSHQHTSVSLSFFLVLLATLVCDCNKEIFFSYWDNVFCRLLVTTFLILLPHQIRMTFKC